MIVSLIVIGLISILGQVVLLRELNVAFYGVELIYLIALGIWLFWTAVGALIRRRTYLPTHNMMALLFFAFGVFLPLDVAFIRASRLLFGGVPGAYLPFIHQFMITVVALLPAGILSGLLFQCAAKLYVAKGRTLAVAYGIESAGGVAGGLFATLFIVWGIQNFTIAFVCGLVAVITPVFLERNGLSLLRRASMVFAGLFVLLLFSAPFIDRLMTAWNHPNLAETKDSPYGRITVTSLKGQVSVFENDALAFETEGTEAEYFCHLAALQHPNPSRVLILGGGIEGIAREMLKHAPERIDYVEINPVMLDMVMGYLPGDIQKSIREPDVHITFADPRQFLMGSGSYDLILVGMPEPASGQSNRFYTREFFEQCAASLNPGGILGFRLRSAENLWTPPLTSRTASIYRALESVFPEVLFLPGATNIVTASREPLPGKPEIMSERLHNRKIATRHISPDYIRYLFTNDRFAEVKNVLKSHPAAPNTDVRPVCYQYTFMIWLSKFFPRAALIDFSSLTDKRETGPLLPLLLWLSLPVIFLMSRFRPSFRRVLLVAVAGFIGMVLETVFILHYQVKHGVLYQDIGILLMSFMAGLAAGSITVNHVITRLIDRPGRIRWYGMALIAGFCLLCVVTATKTTMSTFTGLVQTAGFLASAGFLVAGVFAYASLHEIHDQTEVISPLYAADIFGGCLGSLAASLFLIPVLGLETATHGMLILAVFSFFLV
jgi:spermidine synthase